MQAASTARRRMARLPCRWAGTGLGREVATPERGCVQRGNPPVISAGLHVA